MSNIRPISADGWRKWDQSTAEASGVLMEVFPGIDLYFFVMGRAIV